MDRLLSNTLAKSSTGQNYKSLAAIQSTASSSQLIDVLITNDWPSSIMQHSAAPLPNPELASVGAPVLDDTIRRIKPRYHFAAAAGKRPQFWEREPYTWDEEEGRVARFVSLGAFGGESSTGKKPRVSVYIYLTTGQKTNACPLISGFMRFLLLRMHPEHRLLVQPTRRKIRSARRLIGPLNAHMRLRQERTLFSEM